MLGQGHGQAQDKGEIQETGIGAGHKDNILLHPTEDGLQEDSQGLQLEEDPGQFLLELDTPPLRDIMLLLIRGTTTTGQPEQGIHIHIKDTGGLHLLP